jgi:DNA invertase Pin-like site-specific DNA recombinase
MKKTTQPHDAIAYLRVSTLTQGADGLGIDAQREAVKRLAAMKNLQIVKEVVEVESGGNVDRPLLKEALSLCRANGFALLVAKQDRLSRDAAHAITLMGGDVRIIPADAPDSSRLENNVKAIFADEERVKIGVRTREALQRLKARLAELKEGETLTSKRNRPFSRLGAPSLAEAQAKGWEARARSADDFAMKLEPILRDIVVKGKVTTAAAIAEVLNARGIATATKRNVTTSARWHHGGVRNVLNRLDRLGKKVLA